MTIYFITSGLFFNDITSGLILLRALKDITKYLRDSLGLNSLNSLGLQHTPSLLIYNTKPKKYFIGIFLRYFIYFITHHASNILHNTEHIIGVDSFC